MFTRRSFIQALTTAVAASLLVVKSAGYIPSGSEALLDRAEKLAKIAPYFYQIQEEWNRTENEWDPEEARRRIFGNDAIDRIETVRHGVEVDESLDELKPKEYRSRLRKAKIRIALRDRNKTTGKSKTGFFLLGESLHDPNKPEDPS